MENLKSDRLFPSIIAREVKVGSVDLSDILNEQGFRVGNIKRQRKRYVRTIPLSWAMVATALPGKSAAVAIVLWYLSGIAKNTTITVSAVQFKKFGIHRLAARRALEWLEEAGLVAAERNGNKSRRVTILEVHDD